MPLQEKVIHRQTMTGGMNSVMARELLPNDTVKYMLNCHVLSTAAGSTGIVTNVKGNLRINVPLPAGECETIGYAVDEENNRFAFFVWNANKYHTIYLFNSVTRVVSIIMQNITDTGGVDVLNLNRDRRIEMADFYLGNIYWVDFGWNVARKINIARAMDKTSTGYGVILAEYLNAYRPGPVQAPVPTYFDELSIPVNKVYGALRKFAYRFVYRGGEKSDYSSFSPVATPQKESFTGVNVIPTENNGIHVPVETGNKEVYQVELVMQTTTDKVTEGKSSWLLVSVIDKDKLGIPDNSIYVYDFFNDGKYGVIDQEKIVRPYSFLPFKPKCQALVRGAITYANFKQGWPNFNLNVVSSVRYDPFYINTGVTTKFNTPQIAANVVAGSGVTVGGNAPIVKLDGTIQSNSGLGFKRSSAINVKVGPDVKLGNTFTLGLGNGNSQDQHIVSYTATGTDTTTTVVTQLINKLIAETASSAPFAVFRKADNSPDYNINNRTTSSDGSISFTFNIGAITDAGYIGVTGATVNPVSYETLNDTGQSIKNTKLGDTRQFGIIYYDEDGRYSSTYTDDSMIVAFKPINDLDGIKTPVIRFSIYHQPPVWAKYWKLAVSDSLVYNDFIETMIQKVFVVPDTGAGEYLDLVIGSLYTYQKIHEGTTLKYAFEKGDRLRLMRDVDNVYYPFFETEVISYKDTVVEDIQQNVTITNTDQVQVVLTRADSVGRFIVVNGHEREIIAVNDPTHYTVNAPIGDSTNPTTFLSYQIVDRRGTVRIRKPAVKIKDQSMVEFYKSASKFEGVGARKFNEYGPKYDVLYRGTSARAHAAPYFNQEVAVGQPGIIEFTLGSVYVRNREMPITNNVPGAQTKIQVVEDLRYSDFYESYMNDMGRDSIQDTGEGEVNFGDRIRFSNNAIEDTKINGLNDFDNLDRKDYNDQFGDIQLLKYIDNKLLIFKELRDCWTPVYAKILQDKDGQQFVGTSSELLGDIVYYAWEGGIGDHPESYASNGNRKYHVSVNSGIIARIGGDGITELSEIYYLDNEVREILKIAGNGGAKMIGGFDRENGEYILHITATPNSPAITLSFDDSANKFVCYYSYSPESMIRFKDEFFSFKTGQLWEHNVNTIRNNFYGVQYPSVIEFYVNTNPEDEKNFSTMHLSCNKPWSIPELIIYPSEGKSQGMMSRIKSGDFENKMGTWFASFKKNMLDPRFSDQLRALHFGAPMQGKVMKVRMENYDTTEVRLSSVQVKVSEQNYNI